MKYVSTIQLFRTFNDIDIFDYSDDALNDIDIFDCSDDALTIDNIFVILSNYKKIKNERKYIKEHKKIYLNLIYYCIYIYFQTHIDFLFYKDDIILIYT